MTKKNLGDQDDQENSESRVFTRTLFYSQPVDDQDIDI